jgi:hypothetical protein
VRLPAWAWNGSDPPAKEKAATEGLCDGLSRGFLEIARSEGEGGSRPPKNFQKIIGLIITRINTARIIEPSLSNLPLRP